MRYLSVCSGIEAATVAWEPLGWQPVGFCEIHPFASAVLAHHYAKVRNYGDFTRLLDADFPVHTIGADLLVGGTPCQPFSVAGFKQGFNDPRGGLTLAFLQLARALRPRWVVWENVPGVLLQDGGRSFGAVLGALGELGYGWAYRVLDAQYVRVDGYPRAVPQRRRRVFVVGHSGGDFAGAAAVLLEPEGLRSLSAPRRAQGAGATSRAAGGADSSSSWLSEQAQQPVVFDGAQITSPMNRSVPKAGDPCYPLAANGHPPVVALGTQPVSIRRMTPIECERLQGFPDDYTRIPWKKIPASSCPNKIRYRALGNSMAVNVMRWLGYRIAMVEAANYEKS